MALDLKARDGQLVGSFEAFAGPCEIILDLDAAGAALPICSAAHAETLRIEKTFSRYRDNNVVAAINRADGAPVTVDDETAGLLDFADRCHELSGGRFDVTSGVLRRIWKFDGGDGVPSRKQAKALLPLIGWGKVLWEPPVLTMPAGMEIDLGGIGKEYAVDRVAALLKERTDAAFLVNFGGDLRAGGKRRDGGPWSVAVERPDRDRVAALTLTLAEGALATSGDARRFLLKAGKRFSHVLNPHTGWPVSGAPRSVTVLADTCLEAGMLATMALLTRREAEAFLKQQEVRHWVLR